MKKLLFIITALLFACSVYSQEVILKKDITKELSELIAKGNKVFLEFDRESVAGKYLVKEFNKWGYWKVVEDVREAQFIIGIPILSSQNGADIGAATNAYAEFKTLDNNVFIRTKNYKGGASVLSGWNSYKASAQSIMNLYFKKEFKK